MFDRFSDHSRVILTQVSKKIAFEMKSREVKPEHVLVAIDEDSKTIGARIIGRTVAEGVIRKEVEKLSGNPTNGDFKESDVRFSMAVEKLLDVAAGLADVLGDSTIGTEHLLLGMLKEPAGDARGILDKLNIRYEDVLAIVRKSVQDQASRKIRVREDFGVVYFDVGLSDQEMQLLLYSIERFRGVAMVRTMRMKPQEEDPPDDPAVAGGSSKIIVPG